MAEWSTVTVQLPESVIDLSEILDSLIEALLAVLNIALSILQVIKAFLVGFLNPLAALLESIISEVEAFLNDIRQLGLYIAGDLNPQWPFDDLLGGYQAYERRMIARLTDRTDPTRPVYSSNSAVVAVFLYLSVDATEVFRIIALVRKLTEFFGQVRDPRAFPPPVGLNVTYGTAGAPLTQFGKLVSAQNEDAETPDTANISWQMPPPPKQSTIPWPLPSPAGFLVEVSTIQAGLLLQYDAPAAYAERNKDGNQSRISGLVADPAGRPFRLFGGGDQFDTGGDNLADAAMTGQGEIKDGSPRLFAFRDVNDNTPIPLEQLRDGDDYLLQRTFFVSAAQATGLPEFLTSNQQRFSIQLNLSDMPYHAEFTEGSNGKITATKTKQAETVFVRVAAVTDNISSESDFSWNLTALDITSSAQANKIVRAKVGGELTPGDRGQSSAPLTVTFPSSETQNYLKTVTAALAVLVLSRSDLPPLSESQIESGASEISNQIETLEISKAQLQEQGDVAAREGDLARAEETLDELVSIDDQLMALRLQQGSLEGNEFALDTARTPTGLEDLARVLFPLVVGNNPAKFFMRDRTNPVEFRRDLLRRCRAVANFLYEKSGNMGDTVQQVAVDAGAVLLDDFKWSEVDTGLPALTILESLDTSSFLGASSKQGLGLNPYAIGISEREAAELYASGKISRTLTGPSAAVSPLDRSPGFREISGASPTLFIRGEGSADSSPVVYARSGTAVEAITFTRNAFHEYEDGAVLTAAQSVLNLAAAAATLNRLPGEGGWIAIRLLPQGLPPVESFLEFILKWVRTIQASVQSIVDVILQYIEFVENRILELQAILNRIRGLLTGMLSIQVPAASGLVVAANGTDGVLSEFVSADNKPSDSSTSYGAGIVVLSGGLNSTLVALLTSIFNSE